MVSKVTTIAVWINQREPVPTVPSLSMLNSQSVALLKIQIAQSSSYHIRANEVRARPAMVPVITEWASKSEPTLQTSSNQRAKFIRITWPPLSMTSRPSIPVNSIKDKRCRQFGSKELKLKQIWLSHQYAATGNKLSWRRKKSGSWRIDEGSSR